MKLWNGHAKNFPELVVAVTCNDGSLNRSISIVVDRCMIFVEMIGPPFEKKQQQTNE